MRPPKAVFGMLPHKIERRPSDSSADLWPEYGATFELNIFYRIYESCGGEIGDGHIFCWSANEIKEYETRRSESFPTTWMIFGGDGGGTYFGFADKGNGISFFSCDPIDPTGSVTWLGSWSDFIRCVGQGVCV